MKHSVANELVMRFRHATGLPVMDAKRLLAVKTPQEQHKYVIAVENAQHGIVHDPIENHPEIGPIIASVMRAVAEEVQQEHEAHLAKLGQTSPAIGDLFLSGRGLCHRIWHKTKRKLKHEYGIEWKTPAEMTPWMHID